jgi:hypothetical protein
MNKYLIFRLEKWVKVDVAKYPKGDGICVPAVMVHPKYEDRKVPCFELVKEFDFLDVEISGDDPEKWAEEYSKDHGVRTVVIKGTVFGN